MESELRLLVQEWEFNLRARNLSPATLRSYLESANLLVDHMDRSGVTAASGMSRLEMEKWLISMGDVVSPGTVLTRFRAVRVFVNWLVEAEEIERSPMAKMREPRVEQRPPAVISDEDATELLKSCSGKSFEDRRDHLLLRFLLDTGCRISEAIGLGVGDVDTATRTAIVMGKGRKARIVPLGNKTAAAYLAYLRERRKHRYAESNALFLGQRGPLLYNAAYKIIRDRGAAVGLSVHPHQTRHSFANNWLRSGGSEGDLQSIGGWNSNVVMRRYGSSAAAERARVAHRRLSPGDRL
jgi:site-specific recombinase XerD